LRIVIVGAGEVGFYIAKRLALENKEVVVIDKNPAAIKRMSDNLDVNVLVGSGGSPAVLEEAGLKEAEILLAVTDSDEANLVACLVANIISPTTKKLARIRNSDYDNYHSKFLENAPYIDTVINPEIEVVKTIDRLMKVPGAVDVGEFADGRVNFVGIKLNNNSDITGIKLINLQSKEGKLKPLIAAIVRNDEMIIPRGDDTFMQGDLVYFISEKDKLESTLSFFGQEVYPLKRVMIIGGGRVGVRLANLLEKQSIATKIIEKDSKRCAYLADCMNKTVILLGDGSDQSLLLEENISDVDVTVTLTSEDETNILVSLLAKKFGAKNAITKVSKFTYLPLVSSIGLGQVVSTRLSAIDTILQHVRKGKVFSAISVNDEAAEVIEAEALETSGIVGKPLRKISFPKGAILIGIVSKDKVIIPSGNSVILPGDRVIIFAIRAAVQKLEKMLTVKLEFF